jgi:hypothetical protein
LHFSLTHINSTFLQKASLKVNISIRFQYYKEQDSLVNLYNEDEKRLLDTSDAEAARQEQDQEYKRKLKWDDRLAKLVLVMNLLILGGNLTASILSGSYAVIR